MRNWSIATRWSYVLLSALVFAALAFSTFVGEPLREFVVLGVVIALVVGLALSWPHFTRSRYRLWDSLVGLAVGGISIFSATKGSQDSFFLWNILSFAAGVIVLLIVRLFDKRTQPKLLGTIGPPTVGLLAVAVASSWIVFIDREHNTGLLIFVITSAACVILLTLIPGPLWLSSSFGILAAVTVGGFLAWGTLSEESLFGIVCAFVLAAALTVSRGVLFPAIAGRQWSGLIPLVAAPIAVAGFAIFAITWGVDIAPVG